MAEEAQWSSCTHVIDGMATLPASGMPDTDLDHGQLATSPTSNLPNADVDHGQTATSPTTGLPDMDIDCGPLTMRPSLTERSNALLDEIHHHRNNDFEHSGASASNSLLGADSQSDHSDGEGSSIDGDLECAPDSPLGYARYYGLCQDYKEGHVLDSMLIPLPPQLDAQPDETSVDEEIGSFLDNSKAHVGETHQMERENFDVDEETATFLRSVTALGKQVPSSWHGQETGLGKLKLDLPVLSGDHEVFMLKIRRRNAVRLSSNGITTFVLDDEADEGPHFSSHRSSEKDTLEKEIMSEKLDVDEETIEYLRDVHKLLTSKTQDVAGDAYKQLKNRPSVHVSPPLMPVSPPYSPGMPAAEAMQIDLTSTPEDLIARDAAAAEQQILQEDEEAFTRNEATKTVAPGSSSFDFSPLGSKMTTSASQSPLERKRLRNLKLESPLTPQGSEEPPPKKVKKVSFPADLANFVPQLSTDISAIGVEDARAQLDAFVEEVVGPLAESVMQEAMNEELIEIDTTMRVPIPIIAAVKAEAPWNQYASRSKAVPQLRSQRTFLRYTREETLRAEQRWSGVSKLENLLPWKPFAPYLGTVDLNEQFDDGSLARYLTSIDYGDEVDIHGLIGKRDRLKIFDDSDSDDDEIEPPQAATIAEEAVAEQSTHGVPKAVDDRETRVSDGPERDVLPVSKVPDMLTLLRKKQQELADGRKVDTSGMQPRVPVPRKGALIVSKRSPSMDLMQGNGLSNFLHLQGTTLGDLRTDGRQLAQMTASVAPSAVMVPQASKLREDIMHLPAPQLSTSKDARIPLVVSSAMMTNRNMLRALRSALPNAQLVERVTLEALGQYGKRISQPEADLTVSPSTGLITTTLQKLKQKPLPGQTSSTGIRDHIVAVNARYERLIVLVSEACTVSDGGDMRAKPMDDRDCEALADLTAFSAALHTEVQVVHVAGGEHELVQWVAAAVTTHGIVDGSVSLLQDETTWERFLRRAGINTYAAQAILIQLREPSAGSQSLSSSSEPNGLPTKSRYGLAAFVMMSANDRIRDFGALLGGEHVLRRVNAVLESNWNDTSAATTGR